MDNSSQRALKRVKRKHPTPVLELKIAIEKDLQQALGRSPILNPGLLFPEAQLRSNNIKVFSELVELDMRLEAYQKDVRAMLNLIKNKKRNLFGAIEAEIRGTKKSKSRRKSRKKKKSSSSEEKEEPKKKKDSKAMEEIK
jgi:hypothetical protein